MGERLVAVGDGEFTESLIGFVRESNHIEGITREPTFEELRAHQMLLDQATLEVEYVQLFVAEITNGKQLRDRVGMNVRVGGHLPVAGGVHVKHQLNQLLQLVTHNSIKPWAAHVAYETLHPFMDGNGRSGRAIWAWQVLRFNHYPDTLAMGFLHPAYYAALDAASSGNGQ